MDPTLLRQSYDRFAERYDAVFTHQQRPKIEALRAALPDDLPCPLADLGAGTGLLARLTGLPVVAIDLSREMLARASGPRLQADMARLPLSDACLGAAFAVTSIIDFADPRPILAECRRVLRPGGWLALSILKVDDVATVTATLPALGFAVLRTLDLAQDVGFVCRR